VLRRDGGQRDPVLDALDRSFASGFRGLADLGVSIRCRPCARAEDHGARACQSRRNQEFAAIEAARSVSCYSHVLVPRDVPFALIVIIGHDKTVVPNTCWYRCAALPGRHAKTSRETSGDVRIARRTERRAAPDRSGRL